MTTITATNIKRVLLKSHSPPSHRVFFEVSNDTDTRASRWIDAVALGIWPSTGHEIIGIEIKASKADWRREHAEAFMFGNSHSPALQVPA